MLAYAPDSSSHSSRKPTPTSADAYLDPVVSMISTPSASFIAGPPKTTAAAPLRLSPIPIFLSFAPIIELLSRTAAAPLLLMSLLLLFITIAAAAISTTIAVLLLSLFSKVRLRSCLLAYASDSSSHSYHNPTHTFTDAHLAPAVSIPSTLSASFIAGPLPKTATAAPLPLSLLLLLLLSFAPVIKPLI